jgi:hypothetical protein
VVTVGGFGFFCHAVRIKTEKANASEELGRGSFKEMLSLDGI